MTVSHPQVTSIQETGIEKKSCLIALAGQPNMGKSTLFNQLTGLSQHVGNWPGKTVERREGCVHYGGRDYRIIDLPGTYSLTANSPEEVISREFILREQPDLVVAMVSAANLERSLYLVSELVMLPTPLIVVLNMMDVAAQEGLHIEPQVLEAALGVTVVPMTATHPEGARELLRVIDRVMGEGYKSNPRLPSIRDDHRHVLDAVTAQITGYVPKPYPTDWIALKLLEGDRAVTQMMQEALPEERWEAIHDILKGHDDALLAIASGRYEWIERMVRAAVEHPRIGQISLTDRLDHWAAHPFWGLLILGGVLLLVFWVTYAIGEPLQNLLATQVVSPLADFAAASLANAPNWVSSLVVDGMIGGVGSVLTFLPILVIFFAAFGLLEDVGYMARAAFVMDNLMHLMGLHGKSFLPIFLGFGCNVPAIMGTRVIDSWPARLMTILVAPLVPCTARMAVVAFLAPAFFGPKALLVSWGLVLLAMLLLVFSGWVLHWVLFKGERSAFIMEMPLYHLPNGRTIGLLVWQRIISFVRKAGTLILVVSVIIWVLSVLPGGDLQNSYLARIGRLVAPLGRWMGLDWRLTVALLTSFLAKENSIATLGVLYGSGEGTGLAAILASTYTPATALAFLTVSILFIPCVPTVAVIRQETGSWRWTLFNIVFMLVLSFAAASAIYALATGLGL